MEQLNLTSRRARKARLGKTVGRGGFWTLASAGTLAVGSGLAAMWLGHQIGYSLCGLGLCLALPAVWWRSDLRDVPIDGSSLNGRLSGSLLRLLRPGTDYTPQRLWQAIGASWQCRFYTHHLFLVEPSELDGLFSTEAADTAQVLLKAQAVADSYGNQSIEIGHLAAALLALSPALQAVLTKSRLTTGDLTAVSGWFQRDYEATKRRRQRYGGIGRDWANGFTPQLERFGYNVSLGIEQHGAHFGSLVDSPGVNGMKAAFSQGAGALALIGPDGIGKTSHAYALAQNLLAEAQDRSLEHRQIIALDASAIIAAAGGPGQLERILIMLLNEALHAGNIVLFFDDAQLFFASGTGSFDATQILLPAVQSRALKVIFALTPNDYQRLRSTSGTFASLLTPVVLQERPEAEVLEIIADTATRLELRHGVVITYGAVKEAYRLSGRYEADVAYPGKAVSLLEQSLPHAGNRAITEASVQAAIEQTKGVKAGTAKPAETEQLLHLEDAIHSRMINQVRAVSVVANALRRARAGVANPRRPIGSFLFFGPTGVGKTELAKAVAATYFGEETSLIRLDMSEYQQESDVARLLSGGQNETSSLIMRVRQQPFSVVLLDEIEKAHPNILNLLLQLLDEGQLTDVQGRAVSFKDCVIIATSNAGADAIRERIAAGEELASFEQPLTDQLIRSGQFKPELLNRFDEMVLFRPLKPDELAQVVRLMLAELNRTLATQSISVELTDAAIMRIVDVGNDPRLGARPMRRTLQRAVENVVANQLLAGTAKPGDTIRLDAADLAL